MLALALELLLVAVCIGALLAAAATGALTGPVSRWLSTQLGREIVADGGLHITPGRITRLTAKNLRIANTPWGARPDMLTAAAVLIDVETRSLFQDTVIVRRVQFDGLDVSLERTVAGEHNWDFKLADDDTPASLPLVVERISLPGARIHFTGPRLERPLELELATAEQRQVEGGMLALVAQGQVNARPLKLQMNIGPFASLVAGRDFRFSGDARLEEISLAVNGRIDSLVKPVDTAVSVQMAGPDAAYLTQQLGIRNLGSGPFRLKAELAPATAGDGLRGTLAGEIGEFRVTGQGILAELADAGTYALQARVTGPDLSLVGGLAGINGLPPVSFATEFAIQRRADALQIHSARLDLDAAHLRVQGRLGASGDLSDSDLAFQASGADLARVPVLGDRLRMLTGPFDVGGTVQRSARSASRVQLSGNTRFAKFSARGSIGPAPEYAGTRLQLTFSGSNFSSLAKALKLPYAPAGAFQAKGGMEWRRTGLVLKGARLTVADQYLAIDGKFGPAVFDSGGDARRFAGTDIRFDVHGEALQKLAGLVPDISLPRGPFNASGRLALSGKALTLSEVQMAVAGAKGSVSAELSLPLSAAQGKFAVTASGADIARLLPALHDSPTAGQNFKLGAAGTRRGDNWSLQGLQFQTATGSIDLQGDLLVSPRISATDLAVEMRTTSLRDAGRLLDKHWPDQLLDLRGRFSGVLDDFRLEKVSGRFGSTDFVGRISLNTAGKQPDMDIQLSSARVDLSDWLAKPGARAASQSQRLIPDISVELPDLRGYTAKLALKAQELRLNKQSYSGLNLVAVVRDGSLHVDPLKFGGMDGEISASIDLRPVTRGLDVHLVATGNNLALAPVPISKPGDSPTRYAVSLDLRGSGTTVRELAGNLNGRLRMVGRGGRITNSRLLSTSNDFLRELLTTLNPMATRAPATEVVCIAILLNAAKGIVTTDPALVMRTAEVDMISNGTADLNTEKIDFNFKTSARQGLGFSMAQLINPYIKVTGTLGRPSLTLDPKGTLVNGGAAFATAGLSILATTAFDRVFREKDPCGKAIAAADARN
jgi:uncharacterized protein involved in outer membrane biogenesis